MAKIILITQQKGGVGKSTVAFNLAYNLKDNSKICIIDMDKQGSIISLKKIVDAFDIITLNDEKDIPNIKSLPYDIIFIDTPPYLSDYLPLLFKIADLIIIPTRIGLLDLMAIKKTIDLIKINDCQNKTGILFNMVKHSTNLTKDIKEKLEKYEISYFKTMLSDLVSFTKSFLNTGVEGNKTAQNQIDDLTEEVLLRLT